MFKQNVRIFTANIISAAKNPAGMFQNGSADMARAIMLTAITSSLLYADIAGMFKVTGPTMINQ
jgi:hypothetical protein